MKQQMLEAEVAQLKATIARMEQLAADALEASKYNGWSNHETWLVNVWFGDDLANETEERIEEERLDDWTASEVREWVEERDMEEPLDGFRADLFTSAMSAVDWWELAKHQNQTIEEAREP